MQMRQMEGRNVRRERAEGTGRKSVVEINREREMGSNVKVRGKRSERTQRVMAPKGALRSMAARCVRQTEDVNLAGGAWSNGVISGIWIPCVLHIPSTFYKEILTYSLCNIEITGKDHNSNFHPVIKSFCF